MATEAQIEAAAKAIIDEWCVDDDGQYDSLARVIAKAALEAAEAAVWQPIERTFLGMKVLVDDDVAPGTMEFHHRDGRIDVVRFSQLSVKRSTD